MGNLPCTPVPAALVDLVTREVTWVDRYRFVDEITASAGPDLEPLGAGGHGLDDAVPVLERAAVGGGEVLRLGGAA
ncbi:hypothetical protein [Actinokineospora bangkokensis]|uniref:Uncharacterized protein n=1 Tax=Actinokineospora bangkokensis TaxID=1193682 RepID=A0A1Q9LK26_9PSEU|nr:hypothetical protein [Actinokineospora bangkokensis]OLR92370.1 hypothetical protein BJP25_19980 [Actinokineospora bangkokensis]